VLVETDESSERVNTRGGFWLGAVVEAMNAHDGKGVTLRNVRTWLDGVERRITCLLGRSR
jgi:hypothetical protein